MMAPRAVRRETSKQPGGAERPLIRRPVPIVSTNPLHRLRRFGPVQLGIHFRHDRRAMPQHGPGHVQAELPTEPSRGIVAELVRVPMRDRSWNVQPGLPGSPLGLRVGLVNAVLDRLAIGVGVVLFSGSLSRPTPPPILLGGLDRGLTIPPLFSPTLGLRLPWLKEVGREFGPEPRPEDLLSHRAEIYPSLPAVMLRLVALGSVGPNPPRPINIDHPHDANLSRPHPGQALELDHRPNLAGDMRPDRIDERIGNRLDGLRLPDLAPAPTEAGDRLEAVMDRWRNHPLRHGPLVPPYNDLDPSANFGPANPRVDDRLANRLELERPEIPGQLIPVEFPNRLGTGLMAYRT